MASTAMPSSAPSGRCTRSAAEEIMSLRLIDHTAEVAEPGGSSPTPGRRIYLDNAATSWPKPASVYQTIDHYQRHVGVAAGRSAYAEALEVSSAVHAARRAVADFIHAPDAKQIVFTHNGTDSLNLAIHGILSGGGHAVTTVVEHNSVLRPLRLLESSGRATVTRVGCDACGVVNPDDIRRALTGATRLIVLAHASNVTGALQPVEEVAQIAHEHGVPLLVDAAQSLGDLPIDVEQLGADLLAAPGHKGLLGPLGTGLLYMRPGVEAMLATQRQGGTGSESEHDVQPEMLPDKYEAGNLNVPGILGLGAGVEWLRETGVAEVRRHALELTERLLLGLAKAEGVRVHGPPGITNRIGVISVTLDGFDPQEAGALLDSQWRIQVRSGLHCAPLMHQALGTLEGGGTIRFSPGPFTTTDDIDAAVSAMCELAAATARS